MESYKPGNANKYLNKPLRIYIKIKKQSVF